MIIQPPDAQFYRGSLYYKIGLHGLVYMFISGQWVRTTKPASDLEGSEIEKVNHVKKRH